MGFLKDLIGVAAPIVGGMVGGPIGSAIGGAIGSKVAGGGGTSSSAQGQYAQAGGLTTPGAVSQASVQSLPDWYTNYAKTVTNHSLGMLNNLPGYQGYRDAMGNPAPMVAGLSGTQQAGINNLKQNVGTWRGGLDQAKTGFGAGLTAASQGMGTVQNAGGMFDQAANAYRNSLGTIDQAQGQIGSSMNTVNQGIGAVNQGMGTVNKGLGSVDNAMGMVGNGLNTVNQSLNTTGQAMNTFGQGQQQINSASGALNNMGGALNKAQGYLDPAAGYLQRGTDGSEFSAGKMSQYMNPYTEGVTREIARLGNQNLMENVLPGVNSTFTGAGQFGSTRNGDFVARALRDNQATITGQQAKVLSDAQSQALQLAQGASDRNLQAGAQTGQLSNLAQGVAAGYGNQANTQIGQGQATLGVGQGQLGAAGQQLQGAQTQLQGANTALSGANAQFQGANSQFNGANNLFNGAGLQLQGANTNLNAAQGQQGAAAGLGNLGNNQVNQGQTMGQLGSIFGNLGQGLGGLTQAGQQMGLADSAALMNAGAVEQATNQKGMDAAYRDFMDQRDYPLAALGALSQVMPGVSGKLDGNTQSMTLNSANAPQPTSKYQAYADILGGLSAASMGAQR